MRIDLEIRDVNGIIERFPRAGQIIDRHTSRAMRATLDVVEESVSGETPVNTGNLRNGWTTEIHGRPTAAFYEGKVMNPVSYALPVETGRKPGKWPPIDAIEMWVIRKLGIAAGAESRSVAFVIARKIGESGTKGAYMMKRGFEKVKHRVDKIWAGVPDKITRELSGR